MISGDDYFGNLPGDEIGDAIRRRVGSYFLTGSAAAQVAWRQAYAWMWAYGYGSDWFHGTSQISRGGDQGEMQYVRMGQSRSVLNAAVAQVTSPTIDPIPQAARYSSAATKATEKSKDVLKHVWMNCGQQDAFDMASEHAAMMGEGFVIEDWDAFRGPMIPALKMTAGDFRFRNVLPMDVFRNPGKRSWDELDDVTVQIKENRYALAKKYPQQADAILSSPRGYMSTTLFGFGMMNQDAVWDRDDIYTLRTLFRPSATLPEGRDVLSLIGGETISDGPLKFGRWPLFRVRKADQAGTPFPYTEYFDCLGAAEVYDNVWSTIVTNILTNGVTLITYEGGTNPDILALGGGMSLLKYDPGTKPPESVNMAKLAEGSQWVLQALKMEMEQALGQNAVTRGQSPGDRAPASLAALLDATSAKQSSGFMKSRVKAIRESWMYTLQLFAEHVKPLVPYRVRPEAGASSTDPRWKDVTPDDIAGIDDVNVDIGNDSFATRLQKAEMLANVNDPTHRREVIEVAETGNIEPVTLATEEMYTLVMAENEAIGRGETPVVHPSDDHYFHVRQHALAVGTVAARSNPRILNADAAHFREHYSLAFGVPLALVGQIEAPKPALNALGQPVIGPNGLPVTVMGPGADPNYMMNCQILRGQPVTPPGATIPGGGMPPPAPGASSPTAPPKDGTGPSASAPPSPGAAPRPAENPKNASTGMKWNPVNGGGTATPAA